MSGGGGRDDDYQVPRPAKPAQGAGEDGPKETTPTSGGGGGGTGGGAPDPCDIVQTAALNSPQPAVVTSLSVGDLLSIVLGGTAARPVLEVRAASGAIAGSLTHRGHVAIIDCITAGHQYEAVVVQKSGGIVTVRVQRR